MEFSFVLNTDHSGDWVPVGQRHGKVRFQNIFRLT